jgi:hypothetical protein
VDGVGSKIDERVAVGHPEQAAAVHQSLGCSEFAVVRNGDGAVGELPLAGGYRQHVQRLTGSTVATKLPSALNWIEPFDPIARSNRSPTVTGVNSPVDRSTLQMPPGTTV